MTIYETNYQPSSLAYYIRSVLFDHWRNDRQTLEAKWQRNLDAFNSISTGVWKKDEAVDWRSDTFIGITKQKIESAFAIITDIEFQGSRIPFTLVPEDPLFIDTGLSPEQEIQYQKAIDYISKTIRKWLGHRECNADREMAKNIYSMCIYGLTYAKKLIYPVKSSSYKMEQYGDYSRFVKNITTTKIPKWEYVSVWDVYRDMEATNLQKGVGIIHRQMVSPFDLRKMGEQEYYLKDAIERVIVSAARSGSGTTGSKDSTTLIPSLRDIKYRTKTIELLEFWGRVPIKTAEEFERNLKQGGQAQPDVVGAEYTEDSGHEIEIMVIVADNEVIRYYRREENDDERPFTEAIFEENLDSVGGISIADNMEPVQKTLNGMVRAFEDNKKLSANVILGLKPEFINRWHDKAITPGMKIDIAEECDDVRKAIQPVVIPDVGESLLNGISLFERYADEAAQLPKILQGALLAKEKPDTATEMVMLQNLAGKYLGMVVRNVDEGLIEPMINFFYEYYMDDPDQEVKGAFEVQPLGYAGFHNKMVQTNQLQMFLSIVGSNPAWAIKINDDYILTEIAKGYCLDPDKVLLSGEAQQAKQQQIDEQQAKQAQMLEIAQQASTEETRAKAELARAKAAAASEKSRRDNAVSAMDIADRQSGVTQENTPPPPTPEEQQLQQMQAAKISSDIGLTEAKTHAQYHKTNRENQQTMMDMALTAKQAEQEPSGEEAQPQSAME